MVKIENKSTAKLSFIDKNFYELDWGTLKKNSDPDRQIEVKTEESIDRLETKVSCGSCTKATPERIDNNHYKVTINYKTSLLGNINKKVYLFPNVGGKALPKITINIKGKVIN